MRYYEAKSYCSSNFDGATLAMPKTNANYHALRFIATQDVWLGIENNGKACEKNELDFCEFDWADRTPFEYNPLINNELNINFNYGHSSEKCGARETASGNIVDKKCDYSYKPLCQRGCSNSMLNIYIIYIQTAIQNQKSFISL